MQKRGERAAEEPAAVVRVGHILVLLERMLRKELTDALLPMNITVQQYGALFFLAQREKTTNANFARQMFMTPQSANEMISSMEKKSLLVRTPDANHGRIIEIKLSREGKRLLRKADAAVLAVEQRVLESIAPEQQLPFRDNLLNCLTALLPAVEEGALLGNLLARTSINADRENAQ